MRRGAILALSAVALLGLAAWLLKDTLLSDPASPDRTQSEQGAEMADAAEAVHSATLVGQGGARAAAPTSVPEKANALAFSANARTVRIRVLDSEGRPLPGSFIRLRGERFVLRYRSFKPGESPVGYEELIEGGAAVANARTDMDGAAELTWDSGEAGGFLTVDGPSTGADYFPARVPHWVAKDDTVRLERTYKIEGIVQGSDGKPLHGATIWWRRGELWTHDSAASDGTFRIRALMPGRVTLAATLEGSSVTEETPVVIADAGDEHVVIRVDTALEIEVRLANWEPTLLRKAYLTPDVESVPPPYPMEANVNDKGVVRFRGVRRDTAYILWSPPDDEGLMAYRRGIRVMDSPVAVALAQGKTIKVRLRPDSIPGAGQRFVSASGPGIAGLEGERWKREVKGLPEGTWTITAWAEDDGRGVMWRGTAKAAAGETVDVTLTPPDR